MRLRQHTRNLTLRVPLVLAATVATLALTGCEDGGSAATDAPTLVASSTTPTTTTTTATSPAPRPRKPRLIAYAGGESPGVTVHRRADARKLHGAPKAFRHFIGRTAERLHDGSTCDDAAIGVTVEFLRTDGYAAGGVNDCGGYAALWATVHGRWRQIQGTQDAWKCQVLHRYKVPSDIAGDTCYDYRAQKERPYHQA